MLELAVGEGDFCWCVGVLVLNDGQSDWCEEVDDPKWNDQQLRQAAH